MSEFAAAACGPLYAKHARAVDRGERGGGGGGQRERQAGKSRACGGLPRGGFLARWMIGWVCLSVQARQLQPPPPDSLCAIFSRHLDDDS